MNNYSISTTLDNIDAYAIDMDSVCISVDYDVADDMQYKLNEISKQETDILFE